MDIKKYRLCLVMAAVMVIMIGVLSYFYFSEQEKSYRDGILVQNECMLEEELA